MTFSKYYDASLKLKDGIKLLSRIWVPNNEGPWPALLMRQPYGREIASTITYAHPTWWASKGYIVVIQDVRGQGGSEGIFEGFVQEANDTSETHNWVRSLKECNGKLGLYGFSYQGLTQLLGTKHSLPPDCLSPAMTGLDIKNHWCSDGGAFWWSNNITWALQIAALKMRREKNISGWEEIKSSLVNKSHLDKGLEIINKYDPDNFIIKWLDILENRRDFQELKPINSWLQKPMLILGGFWDPHLSGAIDLYKRSKEVGGNPEIIIGDATHLNWWEGSQKDLLGFFDKYLKNKNPENIKRDNINKIWNISSKKWDIFKNHCSPNYIFGFKSDGSANFEIKDGTLLLNKTGSGFVSIVHDPWRPVSLEGGHLGPNHGIFNRKNLDQRLDIAVFQTDPFIEDIHLYGIPILGTSIISDRESFDICLALSFVDDKDKTVSQFTTGFLRVSNSKINLEKNYIIKFQPTNISIIRGHKLRLSVSSSAWPAIGVNQGNGNKTSGPTSINHEITTLNINLKKTIMNIRPFF